MMTYLDCGCCLLRPWRTGDEDSLVRHANDPGVSQNMRDRFPHPYTRTDADGWVRLAASQTPTTNFAITVGEQAVGGIGLMLHEDIERCSAELGYWLGREFWNRGLTTAAVRGLTGYAFSAFGLTRIYALPFADNLASIRVLQKAGYQCEGHLRRAAIKDGLVRDQVLYAITDQDLQSMSKPGRKDEDSDKPRG
jgi:RimJ/RimL family protein N-acetyltransferase